MFSSQPVQSILSQRGFSSQGELSVKRSNVAVKKKEIFEWLPVTVYKDFPQQLSKKKVVYEHGVFLSRSNLPASVTQIGGSLLIDMPLTEVKEYLSKYLQLDQLFSDDMLVQKLEQVLESFRLEKSQFFSMNPGQ